MQEASRPPLAQPCPHLLTSLGVPRPPQHPAPQLGAALVAPLSQRSLGTAHLKGSRSGPTSSLSWAKVNLMSSWRTTKASWFGSLCAVAARHCPTVLVFR